MLAYILAIAIAFISLAIYLAAFLFPDVHRKDDFFWSGIGLFYALVLWLCASRITGAVLLSQIASVSLIAWFSWQTVIYRRAVARPEEKTEILNFSILDWLQTKITAKKPQITTTETAVVPETTTTENIETPKEAEEIVPTPVTEETNLEEQVTEQIEENVAETVVSEEDTDNLVIKIEETEKTAEETETILEEKGEKEAEKITEVKSEATPVKSSKKGFGLGNIFNKIPLPFKKKAQQPSTPLDTQDAQITTDNQQLKEKDEETIDTDSLLNLLDDNITEQKTEAAENVESSEIIEPESVENDVSEIKQEISESDQEEITESLITDDSESKEVEAQVIKTEDKIKAEKISEDSSSETTSEPKIIENTNNENEAKVIETSTQSFLENKPEKTTKKSPKIISKANKIATNKPDIEKNDDTKPSNEVKEAENPEDDNPFNDLTS